MEEKKEDLTTYPEEETDFSYLAKLSEAYKRTQAERRKLELNDEKREYLLQMQRELAAVARALLTYFEREEKKELAAMLLANAENVISSLKGERDADAPPSEPSFIRAVLLANRSLNALGNGRGYGDLSHMILSEISALYALSVIR